jgi:hypothetical protein
LFRYYLGDEISKKEISRICRIYWEMRNGYTVLVAKSEKRDHLGDLSRAGGYY